MKIDLNCDIGEDIGNDEEIVPYLTSANIACGFHAGDEMSMCTTVRLAKQHGVAIVAHPSWKDREGFGRRELSLSPEEVETLVLYQIGARGRVWQGEITMSNSLALNDECRYHLQLHLQSRRQSRPSTC